MQKKRILGVTSLGEYDICSPRYVIILKQLSREGAAEQVGAGIKVEKDI